MTAQQIYSKITQRQTELKIPTAELRKIAGLSPKQWRARVNDPGRFRVSEINAICNYMGMVMVFTKEE